MSLLLFAFVGCGASGSETSAPPVTVVVVTSVPSDTTSATTNNLTPESSQAAVPTVDVQSGSCGEIVLSGNPARPENEGILRNAGNCLAQAFQTCRATTVTIHDTTNNVTRQFSVVGSGANCTLQQALQTDPNTPPAIADCQRVRAYTTAFVVEGCSHLGDFTLTP